MGILWSFCCFISLKDFYLKFFIEKWEKIKLSGFSTNRLNIPIFWPKSFFKSKGIYPQNFISIGSVLSRIQYKRMKGAQYCDYFSSIRIMYDFKMLIYYLCSFPHTPLPPINTIPPTPLLLFQPPPQTKPCRSGRAISQPS